MRCGTVTRVAVDEVKNHFISTRYSLPFRALLLVPQF